MADEPPQQRSAGRPCKITLELTEAVCKTLQAGVDVETACKREGVSSRTYERWRAAGNRGEEPYATFMEAVEQAMARLEVNVTAQVIKATSSNWQAAAWWIKHRRSGGVQRIELTGKDGAPISGQLTAEGADAIRQSILYGKIKVEGGPGEGESP